MQPVAEPVLPAQVGHFSPGPETTELNRCPKAEGGKRRKRMEDEFVGGGRGGWRDGRKSKKRDSYYRAGCRGRLFSPSSL